jgi:hypothetical protein
LEIERNPACTSIGDLYVYNVLVIDAWLDGSISNSYEKLTYETNYRLDRLDHGQLKSKFHAKTKSDEV